MNLTRRHLMLAATGLSSGCSGQRSRHTLPASLRALAFDAFVLFDPRPFTAALEASFPGRGSVLAASYRARLFEYGWLRALGNRYLDFWQLSEHALDAVARANQLELGASARAALLEVWGSLPPWPDAVEGVQRLSTQGLELAVLSNWSPRMLDAALERSGLRRQLRALSTHAVHTYKPDPRAYGVALRALGCLPTELGFVAYAAWDAAGAAWFGLPTIWMNRAGAPREPLGMEDVREVKSFGDLFV